MTIFDFVSADAIGTYWANAGSNKLPMLGEALFPSKKQMGLDLSWIKGSKGLGVALMPSNFDAKATIRDRIGFSKVETEMPFFRESMAIKEKDRQLLMQLQKHEAQVYQSVIDKIYDDAGNLIDAALIQSERMRMQLLYSGAISISANDVTYTYNYDPAGTWATSNTSTISTAADKWSAVTTADPIDDIQTVMDTIETNTGVRPTRAIMSRTTWGYLLKNSKIIADINPLGGTIMTDTMLQSYLLNKLGLRVTVYTKKFKTEAGVATQFYPDNYVTFLPSTTVGNTWYGTTPEEADLRMGGTNASVSIVNTGVAVTTYKEVNPVNVVTVVSEIVLPSFEGMDEVFVLKVA